jgi:hypothetical protein
MYMPLSAWANPLSFETPSHFVSTTAIISGPNSGISEKQKRQGKRGVNTGRGQRTRCESYGPGVSSRSLGELSLWLGIAGDEAVADPSLAFDRDGGAHLLAQLVAKAADVDL